MRFINHFYNAALTLLFSYSGFVYAANDIVPPIGFNRNESDISPRVGLPVFAAPVIKGAVTHVVKQVAKTAVTAGAAAIAGLSSNGENKDGSEKNSTVDPAVSKVADVAGTIANGGLTDIAFQEAVRLGKKLADKNQDDSNQAAQSSGQQLPQSSSQSSSESGVSKPKIPAIPAHLRDMFNKQVDELASVYMDKLKSLIEGTKSTEQAYFRSLKDCDKYYGGSLGSQAEAHISCKADAKKKYDQSIALSKSLIQKTKKDFNQSVMDLAKAFAQIEGFKSESLSAVAVDSGTVDGYCKINGVWQACTDAAKQADKMGAAVTGQGTGNVTAVNGATSPEVNVNNNSVTNQSSVSKGNTNINNSAVEFKDVNDIADYCKQNPKALVCQELDDSNPFSSILPDDILPSQIRKIDFNLDPFLNRYSAKQCPLSIAVPLRFGQLELSFEMLCSILHRCRSFVVIFFTIIGLGNILRGFT